MHELQYGNDEFFAKWVAERLGPRLSPEPPYRAIGITENGIVKGGLVFNQYNGSNVEVTMWGPGCLTRNVIRGWYDYVFNQLKCERCTARTRRDNKLVCKLLPRLGFEYEASLKNFFGPRRKLDDAIMFRLTIIAASRWF